MIYPHQDSIKTLSIDTSDRKHTKTHTTIHVCQFKTQTLAHSVTKHKTILFLPA